MYNPFNLNNKKILITGASSGIGRAVAIECSKMGAHLTICGRNHERLDDVLAMLEGNGHKLFIGDLTENKTIDGLLTDIETLDGVVFSAGKGNKVPFKFAVREKFDDVFNINFFSQVELFRRLCKSKKINHNSSVVFICSISGNQDISVGNSIYGASKAALQAIVRYSALELSPQKIRVNGINPGMVNTPLIRAGKITEEQLRIDMEKYPLKRYGEPQDIAHAAVFLLSEASSWMTGQSLIIDGGISI